MHLISGGGRYVGSFDSRQGIIQRRIRQYAALTNPLFGTSAPEYGLGDSLQLESVDVEIAIADLYRQVQFS